MECPRCRLVNPDTSTKCDCGFVFLPHLPDDARNVRRGIPGLAKAFAVYCLIHAFLGILALAAATSRSAIGWLVFHVAISLAAGIGILRRDKAATTAVWILAAVSAWIAVIKGLRPLDLLYLTAEVAFAIWYQRSRRGEALAPSRAAIPAEP